MPRTFQVSNHLLSSLLQHFVASMNFVPFMCCRHWRSPWNLFVNQSFPTTPMCPFSMHSILAGSFTATDRMAARLGRPNVGHFEYKRPNEIESETERERERERDIYIYAYIYIIIYYIKREKAEGTEALRGNARERLSQVPCWRST